MRSLFRCYPGLGTSLRKMEATWSIAHGQPSPSLLLHRLLPASKICERQVLQDLQRALGARGDTLISGSPWQGLAAGGVSATEMGVKCFTFMAASSSSKSSLSRLLPEASALKSFKISSLREAWKEGANSSPLARDDGPIKVETAGIASSPKGSDATSSSAVAGPLDLALTLSACTSKVSSFDKSERCWLDSSDIFL